MDELSGAMPGPPDDREVKLLLIGLRLQRRKEETLELAYHARVLEQHRVARQYQFAHRAVIRSVGAQSHRDPDVLFCIPGDQLRDTHTAVHGLGVAASLQRRWKSHYG